MEEQKEKDSQSHQLLLDLNSRSLPKKETAFLLFEYGSIQEPTA